MTDLSTGTTAPDQQPIIPAASTRVFDQLGKILFGSSDGRSLTRVLQRVAEAAQQLVPELDEVSVTLVEDDQPRTVVFTGQRASYLDERQYELGSGPCTDAALSGGGRSPSRPLTPRPAPTRSSHGWLRTEVSRTRCRWACPSRSGPPGR